MKEEIQKAIAAHGAWKMNLRDFLDGKKDLDATKVGMANQCEFGKWLEQDAKKELASHHAEISTLHAKFHQVAADVVRKRKAGDTKSAEASLSIKGDFAQASSALVNKLMAVSKT